MELSHQQFIGVGIRLGEHLRMDFGQLRQRVFHISLGGLAVHKVVGRQDGVIVINAKIGGIGKGIMHIQGVGRHFCHKQVMSEIGELLLVMLVAKEKQHQSGKKQKDGNTQNQLARGERGTFFHSRITLKRIMISIYSMQVGMK